MSFNNRNSRFDSNNAAASGTNDYLIDMRNNPSRSPVRFAANTTSVRGERFGEILGYRSSLVGQIDRGNSIGADAQNRSIQPFAASVNIN